MTQLLWDGQRVVVLRSVLDVSQDGALAGRAVVETPLIEVINTLKYKPLGKTDELALCVAATAGMQCLPTLHHPDAWHLGLYSDTGSLLPVANALAGKTGYVVTPDYRGRKVVAAYAPVGNTGLGMVLKMDSAELFAPVWQQLRYVLPLLALLIVLVLLLLRGLLLPMIRRVTQAEMQARQLSDTLRPNERHLQAILDHVDEGIITIDARGSVQVFNPTAERLFGYRSAEVVGQNIAMLMPEPYHSEHDDYLARYLKGGEAHVIGTGRELIAVRKDGSLFPMDLCVSEFDHDGQRGFIGILRDITGRMEAESKIFQQAHFDTLTDLPNRNLVQDRIGQAVAAAQRTHTEFAVMYLDLDQFKSIHDRLGHDVGDQVLKIVATRLRDALRGEARTPWDAWATMNSLCWWRILPV